MALFIYKEIFIKLVNVKLCQYKPIKRSALPDKVYDEVGGAVERGARAAFEFEPHVIAVVVRDLDHVAYARPGFVEFAHIPASHIRAQLEGTIWAVIIITFDLFTKGRQMSSCQLK